MKLKIILFVILIVAVSGCYTVLKHPAVPNEDLMGNVYHQNISANDDCYKCHTEDNKEMQDYNRYSDYYYETENYEQNIKNKWDSYYNVPWWFTPPSISVNRPIGGGAGGSVNNNQTGSNQTTSNSETSRTTGSTRTDVNISVPPPSVNNNTGSGSSSGTNDDKTQTPNTGRNTNTNSEDKRNTGSTRGK